MECEPIEKVWEKDKNMSFYSLNSPMGFWEIFESKQKLEGVQIPQTVVYKEGQLWRWYFTASKANDKKVIMRKNVHSVSADSVIHHFKVHGKHLAKYQKQNPKFPSIYTPFVVTAFVRNTTEKFNNFLNFKETEGLLSSLPRNISYAQEYVPSKSHFEVFSAPRFYCYMKDGQYECFKEIVEYKDPSQNSDCRLYRENLLDISHIILKSETAHQCISQWRSEIEKIQELRSTELKKNGQPKPKPKIVKTFIVSEEHYRSQLTEVASLYRRPAGRSCRSSTPSSSSRCGEYWSSCESRATRTRWCSSASSPSK